MRSHTCPSKYRNLNLNHIGPLPTKESENVSFSLPASAEQGRTFRKTLNWLLGKQTHHIHHRVCVLGIRASFLQGTPNLGIKVKVLLNPTPIQSNNCQKGVPWQGQPTLTFKPYWTLFSSTLAFICPEEAPSGSPKFCLL